MGLSPIVFRPAKEVNDTKYISNLFGKAHFKVAALLLLRALGAVLGASLLAVLDALGVERAANNVVANTRKILYTTAADEHHGVFLEVVAFAANVRNDFEAIRETYLSDLTQSRIRLLRGRGIHTRANAALLRAVLESRALALIVREFTRLANKLVDSRHIVRLMILSSAQDSPEALGLNVFSGRLFLPNNLLGVGFYRVQERLGRPKTRDFRLISLRCQGGWAIFSIRKSPTPSEEDRALSRDS